MPDGTVLEWPNWQPAAAPASLYQRGGSNRVAPKIDVAGKEVNGWD